MGVAETEQFTPFDRVTLARRVRDMRAETPPITWAKIAKAVGKSSASCRRLLKQLEAAGDPDRPADQWAPIREHLATLEEGMAAAAVAMIEAPKGSTAAVGAIRVYVDIATQRLDLMQRVGWLPRHLSGLSVEREVQQMFRDFAELARVHNVPDEFVQAVLELSERKIVGPQVVEAHALPA